MLLPMTQTMYINIMSMTIIIHYYMMGLACDSCEMIAFCMVLQLTDCV